MNSPANNCDQLLKQTDWQRAERRALQYLKRLDDSAVAPEHLVSVAIAHAQNNPDVAINGAIAQTMLALQRLLTDSPGSDPKTLAAKSSRQRVRHWLNGAQSLNAADYEAARLPTMPPMQRVNMSPTPMIRHGLPLGWLSRLFRRL